MHDIENLFKKNTLRLTSPRIDIYHSLEKNNGPLSILELIKQNPQIERTSVYRTVELFSQLGIIETIHIGWKNAYELSSPFKPHHHHLYCTRCETFIDVESDTLEKMISTIAEKSGFEINSHTFEGRGICQSCRKKDTNI